MANRRQLEQGIAALAEEARNSLAIFGAVANGWALPAHQLLLTRWLEWVERTPGARLIVTMPPRHGKSEWGSILFPAWALGRGMTSRGDIRRVAIVGYSQELSDGFSASVRDHFVNPEGWPRNVFDVPLATSASRRWHLAGQPANRPSCIAVGLGGPFTGRGADLICVDDPIKTAEEAYSSTHQAMVWRWWRTVARTRLQPGGRVVVIMTRWHDGDLCGRLLAAGAGDWQQLHLPAIDEAEQALWPEAYPIGELEKIRAELGERDFAALYQGSPTPETGAIWQRQWFDEAAYNQGAPMHLPITVTAWDTAFKEGQENDYTAWCRMGTVNGHFYVLGAGRRRLEFPELVRAIEAGVGGPRDEVALVEDAASGQSAIQVIRRLARPVVARKVDSSKAARARAVSGLAEAGRVHFPANGSCEALLAELCRFPAGAHDDMHDAFVHALEYLRRFADEDDGPTIGGIGA